MASFFVNFQPAGSAAREGDPAPRDLGIEALHDYTEALAAAARCYNRILQSLPATCAAATWPPCTSGCSRFCWPCDFRYTANIF